MSLSFYNCSTINCYRQSSKQSARKVVIVLRWVVNINVQEMKTSMIGTDGLIIARPLTYQPSNSPEGVLLILKQTIHGQIRVHLCRPPADATQSSIHGKQNAGSRNRSGRNDVCTTTEIASGTV